MNLWMLPSALVVLLMTAGVLGAHLEVLSPGTGFYAFLAGTSLAGISSLALGGAAAFASASGRLWRRQAVRATLLPLLATLVVVIPRLSNPGPIMNDVSTDLEDPPAFAPDVAAGPAMPAMDFSELQRSAYPDILPLQIAEPPEQVFSRALRAARAMPSWQITRIEEADGRILAVATSRLFRFKDDIAIRIRAEGAGSKLDLHSRSRVGRGDLGANAARIRAYQERFKALSAE